MTDDRRARLYAQLGFVASTDAARLRHEYEWPPVTPTEDEVQEAARLECVADGLFARAVALGFEGGTDAAFGEAGEAGEREVE